MQARSSELRCELGEEMRAWGREVSLEEKYGLEGDVSLEERCELGLELRCGVS